MWYKEKENVTNQTVAKKKLQLLSWILKKETIQSRSRSEKDTTDLVLISIMIWALNHYENKIIMIITFCSHFSVESSRFVLQDKSSAPLPLFTASPVHNSLKSKTEAQFRPA